MAVLAVQSKEAGMNRRFLVAQMAFLRRSFIYLVGVTGGAFDLGVLSLQGEEAGMVEIAHAVSAVMAIQALRAVLVLVFGHELRVFLTVTRRAGLRINLVDISVVTPLAVQGLPLIIFCMVDEGKTGLGGMLKRSPIQGGRQPG